MGSITSRDKWPPEPPKYVAPKWKWIIVDGKKKLVPAK